MMPIAEQLVRNELLDLLQSRNAHMDFDEAVAGFPMELINLKTAASPYSPWHRLEHMCIVQWDILEFVRNPDHISPPFPEGFNIRPDILADEAAWKKTIRRFREDLVALQAMADNPEIDLFAPIPHAPEYTIFRELLLAADHNAYHIGEFAMLRQELGAWPEGSEYLTGSGEVQP